MTRGPAWRWHSAMQGVSWPAIPAPAGAAVMAVLHQLERTQWLSPPELRARQFGQLEVLLRHCHASVPWYQRRWAGAYDPVAPLGEEVFAQLPILTRRELQDHPQELRSVSPPAAHGTVRESRSSGSTGVPVRFLTTNLTGLFWNAFTLRDHAWHQRDLGLKLAVVRRETSKEALGNWGPATEGLVWTGPTVGNSVFADAQSVLQWLDEERAPYLFTYPSLVRELAKLSLARGTGLPGLREVRTLAESVPAELRELCRDAWQVPVTDVYSASEAGYLALQCPHHEHYHVQSEGVLLEVLDDAGRPCAPGQVGRVVVTTLHNFAMPLVRYDIGDYAEPGEPCACGRGLPVLKRILGRVRNTLFTADGRRYWPAFGMLALSEVAPILQHQFVQRAYDKLELRLVVPKPLTAEQEARFRQHILGNLPTAMHLDIVYCERIERSASGKFEDLVSEVSAA